MSAQLQRYSLRFLLFSQFGCDGECDKPCQTRSLLISYMKHQFTLFPVIWRAYATLMPLLEKHRFSDLLYSISGTFSFTVFCVLLNYKFKSWISGTSQALMLCGHKAVVLDCGQEVLISRVACFAMVKRFRDQ